MAKQKIANRYQLGEQRKDQKLYTVYQALDIKENIPVTVSILSTAAQQKLLEILHKALNPATILIQEKSTYEILSAKSEINFNDRNPTSQTSPPFSTNHQQSLPARELVAGTINTIIPKLTRFGISQLLDERCF